MAKKKSSELKTGFQSVGEFHTVFGHPTEELPKQQSVDTCKLRINLILEELAELVEAVGGDKPSNCVLHSVAGNLRHQIKVLDNALPFEFENQDIVGIADALTDLNYVVYGGGHAWGVNLDETMKEVHDSNMSKLGDDGMPIYNENGKVMKGPGYREPDLEAIVYGEKTAA